MIKLDTKTKEYTTSKGEKIAVWGVCMWYMRVCDVTINDVPGGVRPSYSCHKWLILYKDKNCKRGEYTEELDVLAPTQAIAKRIAQAYADNELQKGNYPSRIICRGQY